MRKLILALAAVLLVSAGPAFAGGGERGDWELGVYGGYGWLDDYGTARPKNDIFYGARLGYFFTRHLSMELSAQRFPTETDTSVDIPIELDAFRLNGFLNFAPGARVRPFLTVGAGNARTDVDGFSQVSDWGWNAGGGLRMLLSPRWSLRADGRYVSVKVEQFDSEWQNNVEASVGLSMLFGGGGGGEEPVAVAPPPNQAPTVTCVSDRAEVSSGESVTLRATATDPEGDALTYGWNTSAGQVSGNGASATLSFAGMTEPTSAVVTVRVTDSHGNTSTSDCSVRMAAAPRQAEAVSCLAGGFPRNLSRLNNVDKACLDDVAQRLRSDPRATVVVVGHADAGEASASSIAQQRAAAVRDYLVQERAIEVSRITLRSLAADRPLEPGAGPEARSRNRRVEVWFVPEGATVPQN